jgi:hypothetical protein
MQNDLVAQHDREFLRTHEGRGVLANFGIDVSRVEGFLRHGDTTFETFMSRLIKDRDLLSQFWGVYEQTRARTTHPTIDSMRVDAEQR